MQTQTYSKIDEFLGSAGDFLVADEVVNGLILGVTMRAQQDPSRLPAPPYLATVTSSKNRGGSSHVEREIILVAMITPPHGLALSQSRDATSVDLIAQDLWENQWPVPDVRGPIPVAQRFARQWSHLSGKRAQHGTEQRVYQLRKVLIKPEPSGRLRQAAERDVPLVARWLYEFGLEALGEDEQERSAQSAAWLVSIGAGYLWEDERGFPLSFAMWSRPTHNGITITGVYTPPQFRGRGYASSCVAALSQSLLDSGWEFCTLFTDLSNPTSNKIYQRIGYEPVCDFDEYRFDG